MDETEPVLDDTADEKTDLPGRMTWPSVYLLVVVVTVVYVALLVGLQKAYR